MGSNPIRATNFMGKKSRNKQQRNNFVRGIRAESAVNSYTRALGYVQTRDREQAIKMLEERVDFWRKEMQAVAAKRKELEASRS